MPYVKPDHRKVLDPAIDELAARLCRISASLQGEVAFAGLLNYACTALAMKVIDREFGGVRYGVIATISGVFKNIGDEFYRRVAGPYEDCQAEANGDLPLYKAYGRRAKDNGSRRR